MASTRVGTFEETVAKTNAWLDELDGVMGFGDRHKAYMTLRAVLHALRDRLPTDEAVDLAAQLPMLVRGFYYEGWHPAHKPPRYRHKQDFLDRTAKEVPWLERGELERAVAAVFGVLSSELGGGEKEHVRKALPAELRELWARPGM